MFFSHLFNDRYEHLLETATEIRLPWRWMYCCSLISDALFGFTAGLIYLDLVTARPQSFRLWKLVPFVTYNVAIRREQQELLQNKSLASAAVWNFISVSSVMTLSLIGKRVYSAIFLSPVLTFSAVKLFLHMPARRRKECT